MRQPNPVTSSSAVKANGLIDASIASMSVKAKMLALAEEAGTRRSLAREMGVSERRLRSLLDVDGSEPKVSEVVAFAKATGVEPAYLFSTKRLHHRLADQSSLSPCQKVLHALGEVIKVGVDDAIVGMGLFNAALESVSGLNLGSLQAKRLFAKKVNVAKSVMNRSLDESGSKQRVLLLHHDTTIHTVAATPGRKNGTGQLVIVYAGSRHRFCPVYTPLLTSMLS